jgi:hypothetical protein
MIGDHTCEVRAKDKASTLPILIFGGSYTAFHFFVFTIKIMISIKVIITLVFIFSNMLKPIYMQDHE